MKSFKLFSRLMAVFGILIMMSASAFADTENNDNCSQKELISAMNNKTGSYSNTTSGQVSDGDDDYYYFTVTQTGQLSVSYTSNANSDLYIQIGGTCLTSATRYVNNAKSYTGTLSVTAGQTVFVRIVDNSGSKSPNYTLALSYAPPPSADLGITKTVSNAAPNPGDTVTFTLTGINNGPTASQITMTDTLPAGYTLGTVTESISNFSCSNVGLAVTCSGTHSFNAGDTAVVTIAATVPAGSNTNTASITSNNGVTDNVAGNNSSSVTVSTVAAAPIITAGQTFNAPVNFDLGLIVGTVATTGGIPTGFTILSGNSSGYFTIDSSGHIIVPSQTTIGASGTVYTLGIRATNATGSDDKNVTINVTDTPVVAANYRDFTLRKQMYLKGNMKTIGNTVLVAPTGTPNCSTYTNGAYLTNSTAANGDTTLCGYSVDGTQLNSTTSELALPAGAKVVWAGLYWQGMMKTAIDTNMIVKIRKDNGSYVDIAPNYLNYADSGYNYDSSNGISYSAVTNITYLFGQDKWNEGNYTVAGIPVIEDGKGSGLGTYGAWSLVAIYEDSVDVFRSFSVFDGWKKVTSSADAIIPISGFYTPNRALSSSAAKVSVFAAEGDLPYTGDQLITKNYNTNTNVALQTLTSNSFNSQITGGGVRTPNATNNFGIDIQSFDIGTLLKPKQTDMTFTFTSSLDVYWPSMIALSTELVAPQLCYDYSFKQDGHYLKADNNGTQLPMMSGIISDSTIDTSIYVRSNEADILAQGISFYSDVNDSVFQFIPGTVETSNINGSSLIPRTNTTGACSYDDNVTTPIGCSNGSDIRIGIGRDATGYSRYGNGSLSNSEYVYAKFSMAPIGVAGLADVNQSLGFHLNYYIVPKTGANPIPYNYEFGTDIPLCPPSSGYEPAWGTFNVAEHGATLLGSGLPINNLRTKVSRNPFAVDVVGYGKDGSGKYTIKPTANINTTLLVEIIDSGPYHDANATCANPSAALSQPIYVPVSLSNSVATASVPVQSTVFHNFAVQNGAFRIWYFDDANGSLIQNWTATTSDPSTRLNLTSINGLYKSGTHTVCATQCATSTSVACFDCIKANYAKPLCSRDNFAVRPESYDVRLFDIEQNSTAVVKDATKIALSEQYHYTPAYATSTSRINLAAGYNYRYDINATGHDTDLSGVPSYTRYFNGATNPYNATMIWEPMSAKTGCNDTSGLPLTFYMAHGQVSKLEQNQSQVGEYRLNIIDPTWTEVDWDSTLTAHHLATNGFDADPLDCITTTTSTVLSGGKVGCTISTSEDSVTPHINGSQMYKDHLVTLKPAKFDLSTIIYSIGMNATPIITGGAGFVYDSNLSITNDMPMAVRSAGSIKALGYDNATLSNFVTQCYAADINVSISHNAPDANATFSFIGRIDSNATYDATALPAQTIGATQFAKADNGVTNPTIRLNVNRDVRVPQLPINVHYNDLNVSCSNLADCNVSAMSLSTPNTATGTDVMDFNVSHVYGRVIPSNVRVMGLIAFETLARYEAYMTPTLLGTGLIADPVDATWFVNTLHTEAEYGDATVGYVDPTAGSSLPTGTSSYAAGIETYRFNPYTTRQGYKGHINTEGWLWYNTNALAYIDPSAGALSCLTHPCFDITFGRLIGNTGSAKTESEAHKANKKTSTGTGWSTTSEYAPAIR